MIVRESNFLYLINTDYLLTLSTLGFDKADEFTHSHVSYECVCKLGVKHQHIRMEI